MLKDKKGIITDSEEEYHWVLENVSEAICVVQDAKFVFTNRPAELITGYSKEEFLGMPFGKFIHDEDRGNCHKLV